MNGFFPDLDQGWPDQSSGYRGHAMKRYKARVISLGVLLVCITLMTPHSFLAQTPNRKPDERDKTKVVDQGKGQQSPAAKDVVLGYLESRDRIVTLLRGTKGTIYTIKTKDGKTLPRSSRRRIFRRNTRSFMTRSNTVSPATTQRSAGCPESPCKLPPDDGPVQVVKERDPTRRKTGSHLQTTGMTSVISATLSAIVSGSG
jgi:hypothetical protein